MSNLQIDSKLKSKVFRKPRVSSPSVKKLCAKEKAGQMLNTGSYKKISSWNFLYLLIFTCLLFSVLFVALAKLQVVEGQQMADRSSRNTVRISKIPAYRGVILDRDGEKLVENIPSQNIYLNIDVFLDQELNIDESELEDVTGRLEEILEEKWKLVSDEDFQYSSIYEKVFSIYAENPYLSNILIAQDISNDTVITLKALGDELEGVVIEDESKRSYIYPEIFSHVLGYVGEASPDDIEQNEYISTNDIVGKLGLERYYNETLAGINGKRATEVNALGHAITNSSYILEPQVSGSSLKLTIDLDVQREMYDILARASNEKGATGASLVIEDVNNGEILSIVSYPGYNTNDFIGGISQSSYSKLLEDPHVPLLNRALAAQVPPGSTFKTIVAASMLDAQAITTSTIYTSRRGYTFSSGAPFIEYDNHAYGPLNIVSALAKSSNIFFCEAIRDWDMQELVPYLEAFGIGQYTGIDIPGEMPGRIPSPENKIYLAKNGSYWLDPVWYPEGDSCNSVIGQGITLVTPIQMANWVAAIANGGTLYTPHVVNSTLKGSQESLLQYDILNDQIVSKKSLETVKEGMYSSVYGVGSAGTLRSLPQEVAIKTGTAEFGALNKDGEYEHTHAWISGFYPYSDPKYSFSLFFEDGGLSFDALPEIKEILSWLISNGYY